MTNKERLKELNDKLLINARERLKNLCISGTITFEPIDYTEYEELERLVKIEERDDKINDILNED
jgi:hypothetical protein